MQVEQMQREATFRHQYPPPQGVSPPSHPAGILFPLMAQIEFYFSPQNLAKDTFLQQQLSATDHLGAVSVNIICGFPKVKQLHAQLRHLIPMPSHLTPNADPYVVCAALQYSQSVGVSHDGQWIVPKRLQTSPAMVKDRTSATASTVSSPVSQASSASSVGVPTHPLPPPATSVNNIPALRVSNVPTGVQSDELLGLFTVKDNKPTDAQFGARNSASWLIRFEAVEQAKEALNATAGMTLRGSPVQVELVESPSASPLSGNLRTQDAGQSSFHAGSQFPSQQYRVPMNNTMYSMSMPQYPTAQMVGYGYMPYTHPPTRRSMNHRHQPSTHTPGKPPNQVVVPHGQGQGSVDTSSSGHRDVDGQKKSRKRRGKQLNYPRHLVEQSNRDTPEASVNQGSRGAKAPGRNVKALATTKTRSQPKAVTPVKIDLGTDSFPALSGGKMSTPGPQATPQGGGYAQALMKPLPVTPESSVPDAGASVLTEGDGLEAAMNDMNI
eukprot:Nitzschia sp. Nitz4//scaffold76_size158648//98568//100052//NITZ4_002557-RA/size158648-processed-gene-0.246-mRNA-1//1//CDS//3329557878//5609//frame0